MNDYNAALKRARSGGSGNKGSGATIETYDAPVNIEWQTRDAPPTDYENALGDALEEIFSEEVYELPDIVARLNGAGLTGPGGDAWTEDSFKAEIKRLGA